MTSRCRLGVLTSYKRAVRINVGEYCCDATALRSHGRLNGSGSVGADDSVDGWGVEG